MQKEPHNLLVGGSSPSGPTSLRLERSARRRLSRRRHTIHWEHAEADGKFPLQGYGLASQPRRLREYSKGDFSHEKISLRLYSNQRNRSHDPLYRDNAGFRSRLKKHNKSDCPHTSKNRPGESKQRLLFHREKRLPLLKNT